MEIDVYKRIIDYIIEQGERYDGQNLEIEHNIIHKVQRLYDKMADDVIDIVNIHGDIDTVLKYQNLINRIQNRMEKFYSDAYKILTGAVGDHMAKGYRDFDDLVQIGLELESRIEEQKITEMRSRTNIGKLPDPNAIDFMKKHAYEQVTNISNDILTQMKTSLSGLLSAGVYDKKAIEESVYNILDKNRHRASMIAQTEMSMAYNHGALERLNEYNKINHMKMRKYWHGFKYSEVTCTYCRPRIGNIYDVNDTTETLPAHPRCRCVWLPYREDWDKPISNIFYRNADMISRVYSPDDIYRRMNERLGINYAEYLTLEDATGYLAGNRSSRIENELLKARDKAIKDRIDGFDIAYVSADMKMGTEFNTQIKFWKKYVAEGMVDNDMNKLSKAYEAIKGVMILPWDGTQLSRFNKLLDLIEQFM